MVGEVGLEPTKAKPADLQSAPLPLGTLPHRRARPGTKTPRKCPGAIGWPYLALLPTCQQLKAAARRGSATLRPIAGAPARSGGAAESSSRAAASSSSTPPRSPGPAWTQGDGVADRDAPPSERSDSYAWLPRRRTGVDPGATFRQPRPIDRGFALSLTSLFRLVPPRVDFLNGCWGRVEKGVKSRLDHGVALARRLLQSRPVLDLN